VSGGHPILLVEETASEPNMRRQFLSFLAISITSPAFALWIGVQKGPR
jgi:hypothetical protein